jgi:hypothetical protein
LAQYSQVAPALRMEIPIRVLTMAQNICKHCGFYLPAAQCLVSGSGHRVNGTTRELYMWS